MAAGQRGVGPSGRARTILVAVVGVLALGAAAAGGFYLATKRQPARKVILVTIDALRADRIGSYGYTTRPTTPNLDRFAAQSVLFEKAMVQAPWTGPSMGSVMTGHLFRP